MKRKIVRIDRDKCNGCGLCVDTCHEGALKLVDGKAMLVSESYCDGLGACLPQCPVDAIRIEEQEAAPFDEAAVRAAQEKTVGPSDCQTVRPSDRRTVPTPAAAPAPSALRQWPCQIKLVPVGAHFFDGADLLIAADCTAFACASLHRDFMAGKITLIGCPKLDNVDYTEKLAAILATHDIRSLTVLRMEVPCCGGLAAAAERARAASGRQIPFRVVTIGTEGEILGD